MTGRLPFDPDKTAAAAAARARKESPASALGGGGGGGGDQPVTVTQLAALLGQALDTAFPKPVRVLGEVSNFNTRTHWYFALKDAGAVVNCVMFANRTKSLGYVPENGQQVVVTGRVELYEPQGKLTLNVERIEPVGAGALELAYRKLLAEIKTLGWFEQERKRPLPAFPRKIAVVTSKKGAALQDVLNTVAKRCPSVEVALVDVLVQGAAAAPEITRAIRWVSANHARLGIDALLVTRGGGSMEDLWAFNERAVAEAIVACPIPVAAAIGHETDTTIAELVADERCATPTQAAMRLTPDKAALSQQLLQNARRLALSVKRDLAGAQDARRAAARALLAAVRSRLAHAATLLAQRSARLERGKPTAVHARKRESLALLRQRLLHAAAGAIAAAKDRHAAASRELELVGPVAVLRRGYSVTLNAKGGVIRTPTDVNKGEVITTRLAEGQIESTVGTSVPMPLPAPRRRKPEGPGGGGPGLFG